MEQVGIEPTFLFCVQRVGDHTPLSHKVSCRNSTGAPRRGRAASYGLQLIVLRQRLPASRRWWILSDSNRGQTGHEPVSLTD